MKNLLSENMLRFGTKNLSEAAKKELTLKSILETIDQYGLRKEVKRALNEQQGTDPNWLLRASKSYASQFGSEGLSHKFKPGVKYVQQATFAAGGSRQGAIVIMPAGTTWQTSPSGTFLIAKGFKVNNIASFGYNKDPQIPAQPTGLADSIYLKNVTLGKANDKDGNPVSVTPVNIAYYTGAPNGPGTVFFEGGDTPLTQSSPSFELSKKLNQFNA